MNAPRISYEDTADGIVVKLTRSDGVPIFATLPPHAAALVDAIADEFALQVLAAHKSAESAAFPQECK